MFVSISIINWLQHIKRKFIVLYFGLQGMKRDDPFPFVLVSSLGERGKMDHIFRWWFECLLVFIDQTQDFVGKDSRNTRFFLVDYVDSFSIKKSFFFFRCWILDLSSQYSISPFLFLERAIYSLGESPLLDSHRHSLRNQSFRSIFGGREKL